MIQNMKTYYKIGPIGIAIGGDLDVLLPIRNEFQPFAVPEKEVERPDVTFMFTNFSEAEFDGIASGCLMVGERAYLASHSGFSYKVMRDESGRILVLAKQKRESAEKSKIVPIKGKFFDWNYLSPVEHLAKNFIYTIFDYISQILLLRYHCTYLHASAIEKDGKCIVIAGRGGVGKSACMLRAVIERGWRYISDDLLILDSEGQAWRVPKKMQIYGYNSEGFPELKRKLLNDRTLLDKLAWEYRYRFKGGKRVRRRVAAEQLFGAENVVNRSAISCIIFLEKGFGGKIVVKSMSRENFSRRCSAILIDEISPFYELSLSEASATDVPLLPSVESIGGSVERVISSAVSDCPIKHIVLPVSPDIPSVLDVILDVDRDQQMDVQLV